MKKIQKAFAWVQNHILIVQASMMLIALIISIFFSQTNKTDEIIITLLVLIVFDFFIVCVTHLELIQKKVQEIYNFTAHPSDEHILFVKRNEFDWETEIIKAHNDVFISGASLSSLYEGLETFANWPSKTLRILSLNIENNAQMQEFCLMHGVRLTPEKLAQQNAVFRIVMEDERVKSNKHIHFATADRITPVVFVAVDILKQSENTFIKAQHYLHEKNAGGESISIVTKPGCELFDLYKEQIETLWKASSKTKRSRQ